MESIADWRHILQLESPRATNWLGGIPEAVIKLGMQDTQIERGGMERWREGEGYVKYSPSFMKASDKKNMNIHEYIVYLCGFTYRNMYTCS